MRKGKITSQIGRVILAGIFAFLILSAFCLFYYNVPIHHANPDGSTDYKWKANDFYARGTEGFAMGRTNNEGFLDAIDCEAGMPIDVLLMGSSQIEGFNVAMEDTVAARMNDQLEHKTVYSIGMSEHVFETCCCNLEAALERYRPACVVMETAGCLFPDEMLSVMAEGSRAELSSRADGIIGLLQKSDYLRLLYAQKEKYQKAQASGQEIDLPDSSGDDAQNDDILLAQLLQKLSDTAAAHGARLIILYHPGTEVQADGSLRLTGSRKAKEQFRAACAEAGIDFLDMSERFLAEYESAHVLPYGFSNTPVGSGHLNRQGHAMIADELCRLLAEVE